MVLIQEDQPRTHSTVREISRKTGIPKSFVVRIIRKDALRGDVHKSWLRRTALLVSYFWKKFYQFATDFIFFTYEKVFAMASAEKRIMKIS